MSDVLQHSALERWQREPIRFIEEILRDPETGHPFKLMEWQKQFLTYAYETTDDGRLKYPEQLAACPKKTGKTGFAGMHLLTTSLIFGGRFSEGYAIANDLDQAQGRVFAAVRRIVEASPHLRRDAEITQTRITFPETGATIQAIGSDYAGAAGGNPTISCFDELWAFTTERSRRLWDEMVPSPVRKISGRLVTTYAGFEGQSALLEELYRRGLTQPQIGAELYAGDGLLMYWTHSPQAPWQDERWLAEMKRSLRPAQYLRMIENRFVSSESSFVDLAKWDARVDPNATPILSDKALPVFIGCDGAIKHDSAAVVVVTWDVPAQCVRLVWHRIFQPTPNDELDFESTIERTLLDLNRRFRVMRIYCDPWQLQSTVQRLSRQGLPIEALPQSPSNLIAASQNLFELIEGGNIVLYPDATMRQAVSHTVATETPRGWRIEKQKQSHRIDVVVALALAAHAAVKSPEESTLWTPSSVLINDKPVSAPLWATYVFAVLMPPGTAAQSDAAVVYFARTADSLLIVDLFVGPLAPSLFAQIVTRLVELGMALHTKQAKVFTTGPVALEFIQSGFPHGVETIGNEFLVLDDGTLELHAALHISQGRVRVCEQAFAKYHPAVFLCPTARDDDPAIKIAALLGITMALDQDVATPRPRRSVNANRR